MKTHPAVAVWMVALPAVFAAIVGVSIAAVWGLDWRWIPTTALAGLLVLLGCLMLSAALTGRAPVAQSKRRDFSGVTSVRNAVTGTVYVRVPGHDSAWLPVGTRLGDPRAKPVTTAQLEALPEMRGDAADRN